MKHHYVIRITTQHGSTTAYVAARRVTSAVRLALESTKARSFSAVRSIVKTA